MGGVAATQVDRWLPWNPVPAPSPGDSMVTLWSVPLCSTACAHSSKFLQFVQMDRGYSGPSNSGQIHPRPELRASPLGFTARPDTIFPQLADQVWPAWRVAPGVPLVPGKVAQLSTDSLIY